MKKLTSIQPLNILIDSHYYCFIFNAQNDWCIDIYEYDIALHKITLRQMQYIYTT